jgi:hypothetical protein
VRKASGRCSADKLTSGDVEIFSHTHQMTTYERAVRGDVKQHYSLSGIDEGPGDVLESLQSFSQRQPCCGQGHATGERGELGGVQANQTYAACGLRGKDNMIGPKAEGSLYCTYCEFCCIERHWTAAAICQR